MKVLQELEQLCSGGRLRELGLALLEQGAQTKVAFRAASSLTVL